MIRPVQRNRPRPRQNVIRRIRHINVTIRLRVHRNIIHLPRHRVEPQPARPLERLQHLRKDRLLRNAIQRRQHRRIRRTRPIPVRVPKRVNVLARIIILAVRIQIIIRRHQIQRRHWPESWIGVERYKPPAPCPSSSRSWRNSPACQTPPHPSASPSTQTTPAHSADCPRSPVPPHPAPPPCCPPSPIPNRR